MSKTVEVHAVLYPAAGHEDDCKNDLLIILKNVEANEPGCSRYSIKESKDESGVLFFLAERYADDAAWEAHRSSQAFKDTLAVAGGKGWFRQAPQLTVGSTFAGWDQRP